jgi:XisI protein
METVSRYRQIITRVLTDLAEASARDDLEVLSLFDTTHDNYLLIDVGWRGVQRIHHIIAHLRIRNGKIWVEADNTDAEIVQQLLNAGIAKTEIVLAFYSPQKRPLTEFAVA